MLLGCISDDIVLGSLYSLLNILWQSNRRRIAKGFSPGGGFPWSLTKSSVFVDVLIVSFVNEFIVQSSIIVDEWKY